MEFPEIDKIEQQQEVVSHIVKRIKRNGITRADVQTLEELGVVKEGISEQYTTAGGQMDLHNIGNEAANFVFFAALAAVLAMLIARFKKNHDRIEVIKADTAKIVKRTSAIRKELDDHSKLDYGDMSIGDVVVERTVQKYPHLCMSDKAMDNGHFKKVNDTLIDALASISEVAEELVSKGRLLDLDAEKKTVITALDKMAKLADVSFKGPHGTMEEHRTYILNAKSSTTKGKAAKATLDESKDRSASFDMNLTDISAMAKIQDDLDDLKKAAVPLTYRPFVATYLTGGLKLLLGYYSLLLVDPLASDTAFNNKIARAIFALSARDLKAFSHSFGDKGHRLTRARVFEKAFADGILKPITETEKNPPAKDIDYMKGVLKEILNK